MRSNIIDLFGGGGGGGGIPAPPEALKKKLNGSHNSRYGRDLPTPEEDGGFIRLPHSSTNTSVLEKYNKAGVQLWAVSAVDIHASETLGQEQWTGVFWLDTVDNCIWVWVCDQKPAPDAHYLAKVALSDGAITQVGSTNEAPSQWLGDFSKYYVERASMGSGNLTIRDGDWKITLSTADGSVITPAAQVTQDTMEVYSGCNYETADGSVYLYYFGFDGVSGHIMRGGMHKRVTLPTGSPSVDSGPSWPTLWNGYIAFASTFTTTVSSGRFFDRVAFDKWINELADYYGMPE